MIWNKAFECASRTEMRKLQSERLGKLVRYLWAKNPLYSKRFAEQGIKPGMIRDIRDIKKLPFTVKEDLRDSYPFALFTDYKNTTEIHVSSGTTGNPTVVGYTKEDLKLWSEVMARTLALAGAHPGDMIQVAYGYGLFTGGLGFHYGALEMGLKVLPTSSGVTKRQLKLMADFRPRLLACTPSYALYMLDEARALGLDPRNSSWEIGIFGAEPWSDPMRRQIEEAWGMAAYDVYGLSEIIGPGVAQECPAKCGLHLQWDVFFPEVIDPVSGQEVADGERGELVITTLTKRGIPLLRYRTRDLVSINYDRCSCGRTTPRISKIVGRTDDMIIVRGINVFPSQVEYVLLKIEGTAPHYLLVVDRKNNLDVLEVWVEVDQKMFSDEIKQLHALESRIKNEIDGVLGIDVTVKLVEPRTIERSEGKAKRVIDKRGLYS
ncbi:MAG: phenylacetate--CoA ligase [Candidatus Omnitrophica bacterium]|nr:phenylacetate--CoA ligase [Candidatus Omnitrophota bacterium]